MWPFGATVQWNGSALTATFVSATQLTASVTASLIAATGTASVTVTNLGRSRFRRGQFHN
jgi:hypothetical protein